MFQRESNTHFFLGHFTYLLVAPQKRQRQTYLSAPPASKGIPGSLFDNAIDEILREAFGNEIEKPPLEYRMVGPTIHVNKSRRHFERVLRELGPAKETLSYYRAVREAGEEEALEQTPFRLQVLEKEGDIVESFSYIPSVETPSSVEPPPSVAARSIHPIPISFPTASIPSEPLSEGPPVGLQDESPLLRRPLLGAGEHIDGFEYRSYDGSRKRKPLILELVDIARSHIKALSKK